MTEPVASLNESADFLMDLETALHAFSVPADVTAALVARAASRLGAIADTAIFQSYVATDVRSGGASATRIRRIPIECHWDLWRGRQLMELASALGDGRADLAIGRRRLAEIMALPPLYPKPYVILAFGAYGAVVTARIGGSALDAAVAAFLGLIAGFVSYGAGLFRSVYLQQSFLAGLVGTPVAWLIGMVLPIHAGKVLFGGMALLIPATVLTIAIHELANDALESGVLRLMYGLLRFLMLGFGVAAAVRLCQVLGLPPPSRPLEPMPAAAVVALVAFGTLPLMLYLKVQMRDGVWVMTAVMLTFTTQELTKLVVGESGSPFTAAFVLGIAGQLYQRLTGSIAAVFIVPGMLQLTPGFLGTRTILQRLLDPETSSTATFTDVMFVALQIVTGLFAAGLLVRRRPQRVGTA